MKSITMDSEVANWIKRTNKKGPFKTYSTNVSILDETEYTIIFKDKDKVKIGTVRDGQYCRYGIKTFGTLSGPSALNLWQRETGAVNEHELEAMINVWNDNSELPDFFMESLRNLKH